MSNDVHEAAALEHGLSPEEWTRVQQILGRVPSWTELGVFSVMWSEHCSYKSSRAHLRRFPTEGPRVLQGPGENAGAVDIGDGLAVVFKMESHNHPSFIEPRQGAATGVGGIMRDVFTMGARPIANLNALRFGDPQADRMRHLVEGVVDGIAWYGNCMGVPTVGGDVFFHPSYNGNILVNAFTLGVVRSDRIFRGIAAGPGNPVMYVGARTGRDGIHGATMASESFGEGGEERRPTVQVGDPFTEKLLLEACLELFSKDAVVAIQDMGAAGLTSSSVEMAGRGGTGIRLDVDEVPRREEGMTAYECLLSESQERMLLVAARGKEQAVREVFERWDLQAVVVGEVTDDGLFRVVEQGTEVVSIPVEALTDAAPVYERPMAPRQVPGDPPSVDTVGTEAALLCLMEHPNVSSKRWVYQQYDHMVRTNTVVPPGGDAALLRVPDSDRGLALTVDCNPVQVRADPLVGSEAVVAEGLRNLACVGAEPIGGTDCLNFGNPEKPAVMRQFSDAVDGLSRGMRAIGAPIVSGNVSFYNETNGVDIHPTPMLALVGLAPAPDRRCATGFAEAGHRIAVVGRPGGGWIGASEYLRVVHGREDGVPCAIDWDAELAAAGLVRSLVNEGLLGSVHDCAEGGLLLALTECVVVGGRHGARLGAHIAMDADDGLEAEHRLLGEEPGRYVIAAGVDQVAAIEALARSTEVPLQWIGEVGGDRLRVEVGGVRQVDLPVTALVDRWERGFEGSLGLLP
jgi:phosphoribosylformylglycinamidine synthase